MKKSPTKPHPEALSEAQSAIPTAALRPSPGPSAAPTSVDERLASIERQLARIEDLLKQSFNMPMDWQIKELARQTAMGNKVALREWNKRRQMELKGSGEK